MLKRGALSVAVLVALSQISPAWAESTDSHIHEKIAQNVQSIFNVCTSKNPTFSPDGSQIAYISNINGSMQVWIIDSHGGYPLLVTNVPGPVQEVEWNPVDKSWLAFGVNQGEPESSLYVVHPDGTALKRVTQPGSANHGPSWTADGKLLYGTSNARNKSAMEPCLIDPQTGKYEWLSDSHKSGRLLSLSNDGTHGLTSYFTSFNDCDNYILDVRTKKECPFLATHKPTSTWGAFDPTSRNIYLITNIGQERNFLARVQVNADWTTGPMEILKKRDDANLQLRWACKSISNPEGTQVYLVWSRDDKSELELLDLAMPRSSRQIPLPDGAAHVHAVHYSPDGKILALSLAHSWNDEDDDIWILDLATKKFQQITFSPHPGLDFAKLIKPKRVTFKSFDNLELDGLLYQPAETTGPGAFVIDFHGGPDGSASTTDMYQPLLEQGIGVFAPNVRGSVGKGKAFADLDNGPLRFNALKDIKACVDFLVASKLADAAEIGVMGQSHGGYMAMCALTEYPNLFAAGVDTSGPINLIAEVKRMRELGFDCTEYTGTTYDENLLRALSPAFRLDRIKVPFMIEQGEGDLATPAANLVAADLGKRRKDFTYIVYPNEGHCLLNTKNKIDFETKRVEFFVEHLRP